MSPLRGSPWRDREAVGSVREVVVSSRVKLVSFQRQPCCKDKASDPTDDGRGVQTAELVPTMPIT